MIIEYHKVGGWLYDKSVSKTLLQSQYKVQTQVQSIDTGFNL